MECKADVRNKEIDCLRGILIVLVVIGHSESGRMHDIVFLFHMPLFFILSGYLLERRKVVKCDYLKTKSFGLLIPYLIYMFMDFVLIRREISAEIVFRMFYGGRTISGVYWYITCFLFTMLLFRFLLNHYSEKTVKCLILAGGVLQ